MKLRTLTCLLALAACASSGTAQSLVESGDAASGQGFAYRLLATNKTSTLEKEMNAAAADGFRFVDMMGGETLGGSEVVAVMSKLDASDAGPREEYLLLATSKTSTMLKELRAAGARGFRYRGQSVSETAFGGQEVIVVLGRDEGRPDLRYQYQLLATSRTKTMGRELNQAGAEGFRLVGLTVSTTQFGGQELVSIMMSGGD